MSEYKASETAIRNILKKAVNRIREDILKSIEKIEKSIVNHQKLLDQYEEDIAGNPNLQQEEADENKKTINQVKGLLHQNLETQKATLNNWTEATDLFNPILKTETIAEIGNLFGSGASTEIRMGLRLLQADFIKRRKYKPDIGNPGYIEQILADYDKYRLNAEEYRDISYWLNIAETDKWLDQISTQHTGHDNLSELASDPDEYERTRAEAFEKYRDSVFNSKARIIKAMIESPDKTFPNASEKQKKYTLKHKTEITEHLIRYLAWWFYVREDQTEHGMPCEGIGTTEKIEEFQLIFNDFIKAGLIRYTTTAGIEKALKSVSNGPPEKVLIGLEGMLNTFKKSDLRESHFGKKDYSAERRAYHIKLVMQEIEFHKKRLAIYPNINPLTTQGTKAENEKADEDSNQKNQNEQNEEEETYKIGRAHKPGETWPDCIFDELFEIQKRTGETFLKVCERFCENAGIINQSDALKKAWKDHNAAKNKKGTIQAQSRHDTGTV